MHDKLPYPKVIAIYNKEKDENVMKEYTLDHVSDLVLTAIDELEKANTKQIAKSTGLSIHTVRPRVADLAVNQRLINHVGFHNKGKVYSLNDAGKAYLQNGYVVKETDEKSTTKSDEYNETIIELITIASELGDTNMIVDLSKTLVWLSKLELD